MEFPRLKELREEAGKTQREIADLLYCHAKAYWNYESGAREVPVTMVVRLAKYYGVSTDYILGLTRNPTPRE